MLNILKFVFLYFLLSFQFILAESFHFGNISHSIFVYDLTRKHVLFARDSQVRLIPASVTKCLVAAMLLENSEKVRNIKTAFYATGKIRNKTLYGDLIFMGSGDPFFTNEKIWQLTSDVRRMGIRKITGKLVINHSLFYHVTNDIDRKYAQKSSQNAYNSQISSSAVNFGVLAITVSPRNVGQNAYLGMEPFFLPHFKVQGRVRTVSARHHTQIYVKRITKNNTDTFYVSGQISEKDHFQRVYRSVGIPQTYTAETLDAFLNHAGVRTSHRFRFSSTGLPSHAWQLVNAPAYPLSFQLNGMMAYSNNFIADMYTMQLGLSENNGPHSLQKSAEEIKNYVSKIAKKEHILRSKYNDSTLFFESGSGLSPTNRVSSYDVVSVLSHMYQRKDYFPLYYASFPNPLMEESTLGKRFENDRNIPEVLALRAKTGTLSDFFHVVTLAGYTRLKNDDWVAFSILLNDQTKKTPIAKMRSLLDEELSKFLIQVDH